MKYEYRHTKIIFTIGPATETEEVLERMQRLGADICRLNMAHANHDWTREVCARIRAVGDRTGRPIPIMMDVKGPEIRTGDLSEPLDLNIGDTLEFGVDGVAMATDGTRRISINYPGIIQDISVGDIMLVDNGLIRLKVLEKADTHFRCEAVTPGRLTSRRHINLPGVKVNLPSLTEKDYKDIAVGVEVGVEFFALSFVRQAADIDLLRQ
ncbi:MAG TPA: pyruvate kinase, partial [Opitutales bacterium]|nr:pyruvate kinase [Opitutales bacterium]